MNPIEKLTDLFTKFPGIGPRQARRFVYFLLKQPKNYTTDLVRSIENLGGSIHECAYCHQFFFTSQRDTKLCKICSNPHRERTQILIVEKDTDLTAIEKTNLYTGLYFVLGGTVPLMAEPEKHIRLHELKIRIQEGIQKDSLQEVILGLSLTPEGENTGEHVEKIVSMFKDPELRLSHLGRGLSTGSEIEYIDKNTFKNALESRN